MRQSIRSLLLKNLKISRFNVVCYILLLLFSNKISISQTVQDELTIKNNPATYWYTGVIQHGSLMPLNSEYSANLYGNNYGNQIQPLLLSNKGDVIWCEDPINIKISETEVYTGSFGPGEIKYTKAGNTLKEAYLYAAENYFNCTGEIPDQDLFRKPQYNTWIELMYNQNQEDILKYAKSIINNNFPPGVIMIDDNWQEDYGKWIFHPGRFQNPEKMIEELHRLGFRVMVWVCPFVSPDSDVYRDLEKKGVLLKDKSGMPKMVRWWNGVSALIDLSNPEGENWFRSQLDFLIEEYHIDGFKLDAGDPEYYVDAVSYKETSPNEHSELFAKIGLHYPLNEYRANWKMGGQPLANRLRDKAHTWEDLRTLVPNMIAAGLMGYAYSCPDMIGGGEFTSFLEGATIDQELIVRSAQCHALMPMMQFSVAPWRILDSLHLSAVKNAVKIRENHIDYIMSVVQLSRENCTPVLSPMEYYFPHSGYINIKQQFMIGDKLLVAPVLVKNSSGQIIYIPEGKWKGYDGKIYTGPNNYELTPGLMDLPFFERIEN